MRSIGFDRSPAFATLGDGLSLAGRYWRATWDRWLLAVAAVALASGLADWLLGGSGIDRQLMTRALLPGGSGQVDPSELPSLMAGPLAVGIVSIVAGWFLAANAIAGLRGREITLAWVVGAGLRALAAVLLITLVLASVLMLSLALGAVGLLVLLAAFPVALYIGIRLVFWTLAIFDGSSVDEGARSSWALTRNAVGRALGWGLAVFGLGLVVALVDVGVGLALAAAPAIGGGVTAAIDTTFQAFTIVVMAVLYESQRLRNQPPPAIAYPSAPYDPQGPYPPPPPPQG